MYFEQKKKRFQCFVDFVAEDFMSETEGMDVEDDSDDRVKQQESDSEEEDMEEEEEQVKKPAPQKITQNKSGANKRKSKVRSTLYYVPEKFALATIFSLAMCSCNKKHVRYIFISYQITFDFFTDSMCSILFQTKKAGPARKKFRKGKKMK